MYINSCFFFHCFRFPFLCHNARSFIEKKIDEKNNWP